MAKINDFGEKIGGARKDLWKQHGIQLSDLSDMTSVEKDSYIKKDNVWPKPDWIKLVDEGTPQVVAYWQNEMRKAIPPKPPKTTDEGLENYVKVVGEIKDAVMAVKTENEISDFYSDVIKKKFVEENSGYYYVSIISEAEGIINNKVLRAAQQRVYNLKDKAEETLFGIPEDKKIYTKIKNRLEIYHYNDRISFEKNDNRTCMTINSSFGRSFYYFYKGDKFIEPDEWVPGTFFIMDKNKRSPLQINFPDREKAEEFVETVANKMQEEEILNKENNKDKDTSSKRKGAFVPPQLSGFQREGPEYRKGSADGDIYMNELKFRAGEFGNWMDENDRQASLDMGYDALRDLARILCIRPEDISLGGKLAIAFGARGRGGANAGAAHYEPDRQVINLTKMSGAGCLAHEWGHALDHALGLSLGTTKLASEALIFNTPDSFRNLISAMKHKEGITDVEEMKKEIDRKLKEKERGLRGWTDSVKPYDLSEENSKRWDAMVQEIIDNADNFSGLEYQGSRYREPQTNPYVEALSSFRKSWTNRGIEKKAKIQICLWTSLIKGLKRQRENVQPKPIKIETDFYKGSKAFDDIYSKGGHGYWQSSCEMFARAFDCYVADKFKEAGQKSEYLTAYADSFKMPDGKGGVFSAVPEGEERKIINEKFDLFIADLKERGLLHDYVEEVIDQDISEPEFDWNIPESKRRTRHKNAENEKSYEGKQMSFADLLADAAFRAENSNKNKHQTRQHDYSR